MKRLGLSRAIPFVVAIALGGCTNLDAVKDFANAAGGVAQYDALVEDYVAFPARQKRFQPQDRHAQLDQIAATRAGQRDGLLAMQRALLEYMDALGRLASDAAVDYDRELDQLGRAASSARFLESGQGNAVGGIARLLVRAGTDGWRRSRVTALIAEANPHVQTVTSALRRLAEQGWREDAETETVAIRNHFQRIARDSRDPAGIEALGDLGERRSREVDGRRRVIDAYVQGVGRIAAGHQRLADAGDSIDRAEVIDAVRRHARELKALGPLLRPLLPI